MQSSDLLVGPVNHFQAVNITSIKVVGVYSLIVKSTSALSVYTIKIDSHICRR